MPRLIGQLGIGFFVTFTFTFTFKLWVFSFFFIHQKFLQCSCSPSVGILHFSETIGRTLEFLISNLQIRHITWSSVLCTHLIFTTHNVDFFPFPSRLCPFFSDEFSQRKKLDNASTQLIFLHFLLFLMNIHFICRRFAPKTSIIFIFIYQLFSVCDFFS